MKNKKGFTIIEIISVLVIIALIATMAIAGITGMTGKTNNKAYNSKIKLIEQAAAQYAKENSEKFKEEFGECTKTSGNCDCTNGDCVYKFNTTVEELIELGYYDSELSKECLVENPREKSKCFDKEPIEIVIDADKEGIEAHFGEEFDPYDVIAPENTMCNLHVEGSEGTNGWYIGSNNKLILSFTIDEANVARYGISVSQSKTYNNIREIPLSSTTGITYYGYVKDIDGNEGMCVLKNIKVDATNPTDPNMEIDSTYNLAFNGSNDTYSERVKYSYTVDETQPVIGTKYRVPANIEESRISVYAFDYAGNTSNTITKRLLLESPVSGTVTGVKSYYCSEGYTCSDEPCKPTSKCRRVEETDPTEIKKYRCDLDDQLYDTYDEAYTNCIRYESGTVTEISNYVCPEGYTCNHNPCTRSSRCMKQGDTKKPTKNVYYLCYIDGEYFESFDSLQLAEDNCVKEIPGIITTHTSYHCPSDYVCSDQNCNENSTCIKKTVPVVISTAYKCYINNKVVAVYDNQTEANNNCKGDEPGEIGSTYIYTCPDGYSCGKNNCGPNDTCSKTVTTSSTSTTKYTCSLNPGVIYDTQSAANSVCTDTQFFVGNYTYKSYCSTVSYSYSWSNYSVSYNVESCSDYHVNYDCKYGRTGWNKTKCTVTETQYHWQGTCTSGGITSTVVSKGSFASNTDCLNDLHSYSCSNGGWFHYSDSCSSKKYYKKESWVCLSTPNKQYGPYYCDTSVNTCAHSCPNGYTQTTSRSSCLSEVSGKTCTSDKTCTANTNTTCTITGKIGTTTVKSCPSGYECVDSNCNSCTKQVTTPIVRETRYTCSFNNNQYEFYSDAQQQCTRPITGTIVEERTYGCQNGATCSTTPCLQNSECSKSDKSKLYQTNSYTCSVNTNTYDSISTAVDECVTTQPGNVQKKTGYNCPSQYICNDGENCNANSTCIKYEIRQSYNQPLYYCSLTDAIYSSQYSAQSACSKTIKGITSDYYIYQCSSPYACNNTPCTITSKCERTLTASPMYDTVFYCSNDINIQYPNKILALDACHPSCQRGRHNTNNNKCYVLEEEE